MNGEGSPSDRDEDRRFHLFLAEFDSLRQESAQARTAQQSIFQWSMGVLAAVIVGALALDRQSSFGLQASVFGLGLPILVFGASLAWFGELYRMERAGYYVGRRERAWHKDGEIPTDLWDSRVGEWRTYPLLWESAVQTKPNRTRDFTTGVIVYGAALGFSMVMFHVHLWGHRFDAGASFMRGLGVLMTIILLVGYVALMLKRFHRLSDELRLG
jgi:hypothetical protein